MRNKLDLAAAMAATQELAAVEMTLAELILGFNTVAVGDYDWRLRKWIDASGSTSAWAITTEQLESAARAMLAHGYKPSTVNKPLRSLTEPLQVARDNGAKRALIPIENKRNFLDVSADIMEHVDPIFFGDPKTAAMKVLGLV